LKAALRVPNRQALVFDFEAAVLYNFHSKRLRPRRRRIVADAELLISLVVGSGPALGNGVPDRLDPQGIGA
jgi:hypothetical protein